MLYIKAAYAVVRCLYVCPSDWVSVTFVYASKLYGTPIETRMRSMIYRTSTDIE